MIKQYGQKQYQYATVLVLLSIGFLVWLKIPLKLTMWDLRIL